MDKSKDQHHQSPGYPKKKIKNIQVPFSKENKKRAP
jgi:hypothetical protein